MADKTLTAADLDILRQCTVLEDRIILPNIQLDRKAYEEINKAFTNLGGKWNRSAKAHIFSKDPREMVASFLNDEKPVVIDVKKKFQAFYTPPDLADLVVHLANVKDFAVLEPSAGDGALAKACMKAGAAFVKCIEIDPDKTKCLEDQGFKVEVMDFLDFKFNNIGYPSIVMNPPFTKNQDIKHVKHALQFLGVSGKLVAIMSSNTNRKAFQELIKDLDYKIHQVPAGTFKDSGTNVETIILEITKNGN